MSYQVLARKWRPATFTEMVGQEHVLQALINALNNDRLHHAYLFTGTRGVGKTTIARILAKCLNCEQGVSSVPCGECSACKEIAEGRFVDLIEVDAASRTKVEDTRELLDNVQYAPSRGRYKVYLIDEVHMLSGHSFNALLKTLEEPPPHVKFLLATTDPQKLPVTILSRCLQFNLKNLSPERIVKYLQQVLEKEQIPVEESGLWALARSADGSMRDALSLTDQAIAHGGGKITEVEVTAMLGTVDLSMVQDIARALSQNDQQGVLSLVVKMAEHAPDYLSAISELLSLWHKVAVYQAVPDAVDNSCGDLSVITELAGKLSREDVQLFYQICLMGRKDIPLAPDPRTGFEMTLLRLLAFRPAPGASIDPPQGVASASKETVAEKKPEAAVAAVMAAQTEQPPKIAVPGTARPGTRQLVAEQPEAEQPEAEQPKVPLPQQLAEDIPGYLEGNDLPTSDDYADYCEDVSKAQPVAEASANTAIPQDPATKTLSTDEQIVQKKVGIDSEKPMVAVTATNQSPCSIQKPVVEKITLAQFQPENWISLYTHLNLGGLLQNTAANLVLVEKRGSLLRFQLDKDYSPLYEDQHQSRLAEVISAYFGEPVDVEIEIGLVESETPQAYRERIIRERRAEAVDILHHDPNVQLLKESFNAELMESTVKPAE